MPYLDAASVRDEVHESPESHFLTPGQAASIAALSDEEIESWVHEVAAGDDAFWAAHDGLRSDVIARLAEVIAGREDNDGSAPSETPQDARLISTDIPDLETLIRDSGATRDQWRTALRHVFPPAAEDPDHRWDGSRVVRWSTDEISENPSTPAEAARDVWHAFFGRGPGQPADEEGCVFTVTGPDGAISYIDLSDHRYAHLFEE